MLRWNLRWGDKIAWLQEVTGEVDKVPQALIDRPDIPQHLVFYWQAFGDLSGDRPVGSMGGTGPILWASLDRYAVRHRVESGDEFDQFCYLLRAMDRVYLEHVAAKAKADAAADAQRKKSRR